MINFITGAIPIIIGILIFGVLIVVHEWGHFVAARRNGILVEEFAIGMGPKLFGIKKGDTLFTIRAFPMGGFCKMLGDEGDEAENLKKDERAFYSKPVWRRITVILAGAVMNLLLALLIFLVIVLGSGYSTTTVKTVIADSPAQAAGIMPNDKIVKINGSSVRTFEELQLNIERTSGNSADVTILRGKEKIVISIVPKKSGEAYILGVTPQQYAGVFIKGEGLEKVNISGSISNAFWQLIYWIKMSFFGISELFKRNVSLNDMAGPIGIVSIIGNVYTTGVTISRWLTAVTILRLMAIISASIGIFNLLPLPALDGGRFVFLLVEGIRKKPVPPEKEGLIHFVGLVALMALGVFIAYNDIAKIFFK